MSDDQADNPYAPPAAGLGVPGAAPPPLPAYGAPAGWQSPAPPPPQYPPYGAPAGWQPPPPPPQYSPYGAPGWGPGGYGYGYPQPEPGLNGFAVTSLICSIALFWLCGIGSLLGVIFGIVGLRQISRTGERGRGLAIAGIIIGAIVMALVVVVVVVGLATSSSGSGGSSGVATLGHH